jgi:hypothetical protein
MEYIIFGVAIIIAIIVSNFATHILVKHYPNINRFILIIFDVVIYVSVYVLSITIGNTFDLNDNFEKQSKEMAVSIVNRTDNPIIGSDLISKSSDTIVWRIISQSDQSNTIIYECKAVKKDTMVSTICRSKSKW